MNGDVVGGGGKLSFCSVGEDLGRTGACRGGRLSKRLDGLDQGLLDVCSTVVYALTDLDKGEKA